MPRNIVYYMGIPICLVLAFVVAARLRWPGSEGDVPPQVAQQRAVWAAHAPAQYILNVDHSSGGRAPSWFTLSQVTRGKLDNVLCRLIDKGGSITECKVSNELNPLTVEQAFAAIEAAYRGKAAAVQVLYDAKAGFPVRIDVDPVATRNGDEWGLVIDVKTAAAGG